MAILNVRSVPATSDQNSNSKSLIQMVYEEQMDKYYQPDTSVSENKDTHIERQEVALPKQMHMSIAM